MEKKNSLIFNTAIIGHVPWWNKNIIHGSGLGSRRTAEEPQVLTDAEAEVTQVLGTRGNVDETDLHRLKYLKAVVEANFETTSSSSVATSKSMQREL